jgi:hypothetical protein
VSTVEDAGHWIWCWGGSSRQMFDWFKSKDPVKMYACVRKSFNTRTKGIRRRLRLYACACCRMTWDLIGDRGRASVEASERFADGQGGRQELEQLEASAKLEASELHRKMGGTFAPVNATTAAALSASSEITRHARQVAWLTRFAAKENAELPLQRKVFGQHGEQQCLLLRDIFGNSFSPIATEPRWLTSTVTNLAHAIYTDRAFDRLPILADALEDAGCTNAEILNHCRQPGVHVRGCWVVDLLLGKE